MHIINRIAKIADTKKALEGTDTEAIKAASDALQQKFYEVSSKQELEGVLDGILTEMNGIDNTFLQDTIGTLKEEIKTTKTKVQSIKASNEQGGN